MIIEYTKHEELIDKKYLTRCYVDEGSNPFRAARSFLAHHVVFSRDLSNPGHSPETYKVV